MTTITNIIKKTIFVFLITVALQTQAQNVSVYKIDQLLNRIHNNSDTTYVVNFWATWCKPCVAELPEFEKLNQNYSSKKVKVLLVSMDFKEALDKKLKPFLAKNNYTSQVVLLDEVNGNDFINKVSKEWSGALPATLIVSDKKSINRFFEKKVTYEFLEEQLN